VMCAGALGWSQIGKVVFGASDDKRGYRKFAANAMHPKTEIVGGVLDTECRELIQEFFRQKR